MKKIFSIILASLTMVSCVDTVILPDDKTVDEDMWQTGSDVAGVVACAYSQMRDEALMRNLIVWGDFRSDELVVSNNKSALTNSTAYVQDLNEIYTLNINPSNAFTNWNALYSAINYCNLVLEKAGGVMNIDPNYTEGTYLADCSKVKALRALCYFYLVRVFRDVPVTPGVYMSSEQNMLEEQKDPESVLNMCIEDLKDAEKASLVSNAYGDWRDKGYITRDGIRALLADIHLWRASVKHSAADYQACIDYCDKVIEAKKLAHVAYRGEEEQPYYLADRDRFYDDLFGSNGQNAEESIFEIQYHSVKNAGSTVTTQESANRGLDQMYNKYNNKRTAATSYVKTTANYAVVNSSGSSSNLFKTKNDKRIFEYVYGAGETADDVQFGVRKFCSDAGYTDANKSEKASNRETFYQNWIVYRLSDVMLMKAEALVQLYEMSDKSDEKMNEQAFELVTFVNKRAIPKRGEVGDGDTLKYKTYKDRMENLVLQERARELCFEGKRWFDLMRYNYRHVEGVQYDKTFAELGEGGNYVANYDDMLNIVISKYSSTAMKSKMPTEPYLYWPINTAQMDVNTKLKQNPVWKKKDTTSRN